ncbi:rhodanese-like domain-containing protein [Autumnicola edwardsiae]|jgi:rhodanese-related sulfurtransferase|uniref:Rhodanese-like domain-containing protein n=1 Tax=Autumnicola edwardsiae TaxID=3075594 RepID=A0ABU3CR07_9FLAO|nr:rhodanese-like domain-containing protein [Zunongwangia sp. F297]MDT0648780.1 rhodanese-like domain-containing protein [Zunongwangia sp. F297]
MKELSQEEWRDQLKEDSNAVILDVRTDEEIEEGFIPGAKKIDIYKGQGFIDEIDKLDKSKNYYIYCRSGKRSAQACSILDQKEFQNTYNLQGGFMEWQGEVEGDNT